MRIIIALLFSISICSLFAQKQTPQEYIEKYKDIAIVEMYRSGVPASITLSQGILESNSGNSRLAKFANNHFGIKCKGSWTGNVIYANDDEPDECFRAYESVLDSYHDHSDFLRKNWRYHPLFELDPKDYKGWCHGLRKAGYATNPQYGNILIRLIERYELDKYDKAGMPGTSTPEVVAGPSINGIPVKTVTDGETVTTIARDNDLKDRHIRKWNDLPEGTKISTGEIVYLKPKRRRGSEEQHTVAEGEDMREISQLYGIKLKQLYKKNRMEQGIEPATGEVLYMQSKRDKEDEVKTAEKTPQWSEDENEEEAFVNPHTMAKKIVDTTDFSNPGALNKKTVAVPDYHLVAKGDNIYRIAEKYQVFEEDILTWNKDLNPSAMSIGQKIYLKEAIAKAANAIVENPTIEEIKAPTTEKEIEEIKKEITVDGPVTHHVVKGDTLYNICKRYNVTVEQLKEWNKLENITIKLGQKLQVSE